jgi:cyclopropane fatty-acyl-phospholipid synthase-like methyltransferase
LENTISANQRAVARHYKQFWDLLDRRTTHDPATWEGPPPILNIGYWAHGAENSREAQLEMVRFAASRLPDLRGRRVLDIGCGMAGPASILARDYGALVDGITIVDEQVAWARRYLSTQHLIDRVRVHLASAMSIPFPPDSFDVVWCLEAAHCFTDKPAFLTQAATALRPGGTLLLIDIVATSHLPLVRWQPALGLNLVTLRDWQEMIRAAGFRISESQFIGNAVYPGFRRGIAQTAASRRDAIYKKLARPNASGLVQQVVHGEAWMLEFVLCRSVLPIGSWAKLREYALVVAQKVA